MTIRVVITGAAGQLGRQLDSAFREHGDATVPLTRPAFDLAETAELDLRKWEPDVVINAAAWTDVDGCARDPARAELSNGLGAGRVARAAAAVGALAVQVSTNEVFSGEAQRPYVEDDSPEPINAYGASKLLGERLVAAAATSRHLIVRTAWLFGPGSANFVTKILAAADRAREAGGPLRVVGDEWGNPTATPWVAADIVALVHGALNDDRRLGIHHRVGEPPTSRAGWARRILTGAGVDIEEISSADYERASRVPLRAVLASTRHLEEPPHDWRSATDALVADILSSRTVTSHG
jgi:dTDP-4-dehydrorhamnose reductase